MIKLKNKLSTRLKQGYTKSVIKLLARRSWILKLYEVFWKPKKGTESLLNTFSLLHPGLSFIQIGANDGFTHDPICKFIYRDRWKGILVEPQKAPYENGLKVLYDNNPNVFPVNAAISDKSSQKVLYVVAFSEARWATGLASFNKENVLEHFENGHAAYCAHKEGIDLPKDSTDYIRKQMVSCVTFSELMEKYSLSSVDLVQIDAEGFDFEVIKMIDFETINPLLISFESTNLSAEDKKDCFDFLSSKGYLLYTDNRDTIALKASEARKEEFDEWFNENAS